MRNLASGGWSDLSSCQLLLLLLPPCQPLGAAGGRKSAWATSVELRVDPEKIRYVNINLFQFYQTLNHISKKKSVVLGTYLAPHSVFIYGCQKIEKIGSLFSKNAYFQKGVNF